MRFTNLPQTITERNANLITEVLGVFENGHKGGNYDAYVAYKDKLYNHQFYRQITYGRFQTTEFGNLKKLLEMYIQSNGDYADYFRPFLDQVGIIRDGVPKSLYLDDAFVDKLKIAGREDSAMQEVQDEFFEKIYFQPALNWFVSQGFLLPLSLLVIFDSHIHSGGMLGFLRKRFSEYPPILGGDEKTWITQYVATRHAWLANYETKETRASKYRTQTFKNLIAQDNWNLDKPFTTQGIKF